MDNTTTSKNRQAIMEQTIKSLAALNSLLIQSNQCQDADSFIFHILNHTVSYIHYDRATLLQESNRKVLGISGTVKPSANSGLLADWRNLSKSIQDPTKLQILSSVSFSDSSSHWEEYQEKNHKTSVLWLPLQKNNNSKHSKPSLPAGLWLERWEGRKWRESELKAITPLQEAYTGSWSTFSKKSGSLKKSSKSWLLIPFLVSIIALLYYCQISERIVSPCEIVPEQPDSVTAEIDGVIKDISVTPGEHVTAGSLLIEFTDDIIHEELTAAEQQVKITLSELQRAQAQAVTDKQVRSHLIGLENQLKKDQTRLRIARYRLEKSRIYAQKDGVIMMNDPHEWEGKPVSTGERIMLLINPEQNKIQIFLPLNDKIDFPEKAPVKIILNTDSAVSREAHLTYLSEHSTLSPTGVACFLAEAKFNTPVNNIRMGVQGTAIVFGKKVTLGYWLIRRPLAAIRNFIGI